MFETNHRSVERMDGGGFVLRWRLRGRPGRVSVFAGAAPDAIDFTRALVHTREDHVRVSVPEPLARPYFALAREGHRLVLAERRIPLDGASNFRDLGGYRTADGRRVRWGAVYRSDRLAELSDADCRIMSELRIGLVLDLRSDGERAEHPDRLDFAVRPAVALLPIEGQAGKEFAALIEAGERRLPLLRAVIAGGYRELVDDYRDVWTELFARLLAAPGDALLVHCSAGQDRTGLAVALLLLALAVPREVVIADYMLTALWAPKFDAPSSEVPFLREVWRPGPELLEAGLDAMVASHGSIDGYLRAIGVDEQMRAALRDRLLA